MKSASSLKVKLLLTLIIAFSIASEGSAQTLRKIDLGNDKPLPRSSHTLVNVNGRVFMFGGFNAALPPDAGDFSPQTTFKDGTHEFDPVTEKFVQSPGPEGQAGLAFTGSAVIERTGDALSFFGLDRNQNNFNLNTIVHAFNPVKKTWEKRPPINSPPERENPGVVTDGVATFIFGGRDMNGRLLDDVWLYDPDFNDYTQRASMPEAIDITGTAVDERGFITVFGTNASFDPVAYVFEPGPNRWTPVTGNSRQPGLSIAQAEETPAELLSRRFSAQAQVGNTLYLFGGRSKNNQELDDIIKIVNKEDNTFTVERLSPKFPAGFSRSRAAVVSLTPIAGFEASGLQTVEILIFGGIVRGQEVNDAYIFTDTVEVAAPPPDECTGGPTVKSISVGGKTKIKGNGFLDGLTITVNGIAFNKSPSVTPNKVTQKGPLANGQTATEACAGGCEFKITNGDNKCTKVSVP